MAKREIIVELRLEDQNAVVKLGKLEIETKQYQRQLALLNAEIRKNGTATTEQARKVGELSASIRRNQTVIRELKNDLSGATAAGLRFRDKMADAARAGLGAFGLNILGVTAGVTALVGVLRDAGKTVADFDKGLSSVSALGGEYAANIEQISAAAKVAGLSLGITAQESLSAVEALAKAGVSAADILGGGLTGALTLAAAGELSVADAAEIAAKAMTQFGLAGEDIPHIADLLTAGALTATGQVSDFGAALAQSGLVANQFGISIDDTIGTLTAFASAGLVGSDAGTSFRTMLLRLGNPSNEAAETMERLGIAAFDAQGNFVGLENLAGQLQTQLGSLTQEQRNQALATIFGTDAIRGANVLFEQGAEGVREYAAQVNQSGIAQGVAAEQTDNLGGAVDRLSVAWDNFILSIEDGDGKLANFLTDFIGGVTDAINFLSGASNEGFKDFTGDVQAQLKALGSDLELTAERGDEVVDTYRLINDTLKEFAKTQEGIDLLESRRGQVAADLAALEGRTLNEQELIRAAAAKALIRNINEEITSRRQAMRERENEAAGAKQAAADIVAAEAAKIGTLTALRESLKTAKDAKEALNESDTAGITAANTDIAAIEAKIKALDQLGIAARGVINVANSISFLEAQIAALKKQQAQSTKSEQFATYQKQIDELLFKIEQIKAEVTKLPTIKQTAAPIPEQDLRTTGDQGVTEEIGNTTTLYNAKRILAEGYYAELNTLKASDYESEAAFTAAKTQLHSNYIAQKKALEETYYTETAQSAAMLFDALSGLAAEGSAEQKAFAIAAAIANTYVGVTKALSDLPPPASYIAAAATVAQGLSAVSKIQSTNPKGFAVGGYTEQGPKHKPVGVVHGGEWVAPKWQVNHPDYAPMIAWLEEQRTRRGGNSSVPYISGGGVHGVAMVNAKAPSETDLMNIENAVAARLAFDRPMQVDVVEINKAQRNVRVAEKLSTA